MNQNPEASQNAQFLTFWQNELEKMSSAHILHWAVDVYCPRLVLKTAFEPEGCIILSMLSKIVPKVTVLCNEIDYQMQHFWNVSGRFYTKTGLQIIPVHMLSVDDKEMEFDAILETTRRQGRPGIGVLGRDQAMEIPTISPLVRWSHDAVIRKLKQDAILDSSYINIWQWKH